MDQRYAACLGRVVAILTRHHGESDYDGVRPCKCGRMEYHVPDGIPSGARLIVHTMIAAMFPVRVPHAVGHSSSPPLEWRVSLLRSRWSTLCATVWLGCLLLNPNSARAQDVVTPLPVTWGIVAGGDGVTGAYRGKLEEGVVGGLVAQLPLAYRHFTLRADLMYHWIGTSNLDRVTVANGEGCNGILCTISGSWSRIVSGSLGVMARLNDPNTRWSPYLLGGVAGYLTGNSDEPLAQYRPNHLGFQGGVGFEFRPSKHTYFVEMRYMGVPPGGVAPVMVGMRF